MKKIFSLIIMCVLSATSLFAQTSPNRVLITDKLGTTKGFLAERIDSIWFAQVDGRIAATIDYKGFKSGETGDTLKVAITRTSGCQAFRIDCLPKNRADMLNSEAAIANYLDQSGSEYYWQDFTDAAMTGYTFTPGVDYTIITVGYDQYGVACGAERCDFTAPKKDVVGDCSINYNIDEVTTDKITISFTPSSGVAGYAACSYPAGTAEQQFQMMGGMFGFTQMGDMIKAFGFNNTGNATNTWENMDPGSDYEIYVQAWDVNGTYADMLVIPVTTKKLGGEGVAEMTIEVGKFGGDATNGYYQVVTYIPNDQTSVHRDILMEKEGYEKDWTDEKVIEYLKTDNPTDSYWNQYGVDEARWTADPSTDYIAFSIAQNINGEWGPLAKKELTTPDSPAQSVAPKKGVMSSRIVKKTTSGVAPTSLFMNMVKAKSTKMQLSGK